MPLEGQLVIATLSDGSEINAYVLNGKWWTGLENNPDDVEVVLVVSWREMQ